MFSSNLASSFSMSSTLVILPHSSGISNDGDDGLSRNNDGGGDDSDNNNGDGGSDSGGSDGGGSSGGRSEW